MNKPLIRDLRLIGEWSDLAKYYVDVKTGMVWIYSKCTGGLSNAGEEEAFRARFSNMYRGKLFDAKETS